jgi:hypothetical protein
MFAQQKWGEKCPKRECPNSYRKLNFPAQLSKALHSKYIEFGGTQNFGTFPHLFLLLIASCIF